MPNTDEEALKIPVLRHPKDGLKRKSFATKLFKPMWFSTSHSLLQPKPTPTSSHLIPFCNPDPTPAPGEESGTPEAQSKEGYQALVAEKGEEMELVSFLTFAAMVTAECMDVALSVISKAAMNQGMNNFVSVVYYNALATLILVPYFLFRWNRRAPLTFSLLWRFFLLAFLGSSGQIIYFIGIKFSSPTLSSALANLIPIFTFLLAILFRMEKLNIRRSSSQAKALGAFVAVTGSFIVTLYKGPPLLKNSSTSNSAHQLLHSQEYHWIIGGLLLLVPFLESAIWNVFQAATVQEYPEEMTIVFFFTLFITIQTAIFSALVERNLNAWKLKTKIEIMAIVSQAIFGSLFRISIHTWCLRKRGPVYVAMFKPLGMVIAVVLTFIFLGSSLYLGSVVGGIVIALGFYTVMWGQTKEKNSVSESEDRSLELGPSLQNQ